MKTNRRILGVDPGLRHTGWGIVLQQDNRLSFIAAGRINPDPELPMAERLRVLASGLAEIAAAHAPDEAAIEETFVNKNAASALKLGQARGAAMLALAQAGLSVSEYSANKIKQCVTGYGHADKAQIQAMIRVLLPGSGTLAADAADALAVAITHAHHTPHASSLSAALSASSSAALPSSAPRSSSSSLLPPAFSTLSSSSSPRRRGSRLARAEGPVPCRLDSRLPPSLKGFGATSRGNDKKEKGKDEREKESQS